LLGKLQKPLIVFDLKISFMKNILLTFFALILQVQNFSAQTTSWKGTTNSNWNVSGNWTAGVPVATIDAIIGDANFTGASQPKINVTAACRSLTLGNATKVSTLTIAKNITVSGDIIIGNNGTITHNTANTVITLKGNWLNSGMYNATLSTVGVTFSGAAQSLTGATTFQKVTVNSGSILTLANNIIITSALSVTGTIDPTAFYIISGTAATTLNSGGTLLVKAATFGANYSLSGTFTINGTSTINYASSTINQTISNSLTYGYLRASGGMIKSLAGNLPALISANLTAGRIYVDAGTLDLQTYTADRGSTVAGGSVIIASGAKLRIGGTNGFPLNYSTITIASNSTVEYYGNNQTVLAATYGNLIFSSTSGIATKTMPATAFTVAGNLTSSIGTGTGVSFTAGNKITVNLDVSLDAGTTFDGSSFSHVFKGNWANAGTFTGNTSSVTFSGVSAILSGTGTNNFYNLAFSGAGITASATTTLNVASNLSTSGSGTFTHNTGGNIFATGVSKTFTGNGLNLYNCIISGSITTNANCTVSGDFTVNGSFAASAGIFTMGGASKTIAGSGTCTFYTLNIFGSISTANSFTLLSNFSVAFGGSFLESAGTATFNGITVLSGIANLYNVAINSVKTLRLGTNAILGIANIFTKTGTLNVTTTSPNTVKYNGPGAQTITNATYSNLIAATGGTKTAGGAVTVNNDFTISSSVTYNASSFIFIVGRHFTNSGTFNAATSSVQLTGANAATITGVTTFYQLIENKSTASVVVTLASNITTNTLTLTNGNMETNSDTIKVTGTRGGNGLITGAITHSHVFTSGTAYSFEGPNNLITFTSPSASLNLVTVTSIIGEVADFNPGLECVMREYDISIPAGTFTNAILRMHYQDNELNAFDEPTLTEYKFNSGINWDSIGYTSRSSVTNFVERIGITTLAGRWALSGTRNLVRWNGSVSSAWETAANWTTISGSNMANRIPSSTDAAQIGQGAFTNQPILNSAQTINILRYGSVQSSTLTIANGSLTTIGSIQGLWTANASHTFDISSYTLSIGTNLKLSDGINGHDIKLKIGSGSVTVTNDITQSGTGAVNFTGNGTLIANGHYNYTSGSFIGGSGTVIYTGGEAQNVAPVTYNNLSFTKTTERAKINSATIINGNLTTSVGGELALYDTITVVGNIIIGASTNLFEMGTRINVGGSFTTNGLFTVSNGSINFNGTGNQNVNANIFNTLMVNKPSGTLSATGDLLVNSDITVNSGTFDMATYLANRSNPGGTFTLGAGANLKVGGANNYPNNFIITTIDAASTVEYYGAIAQNVKDGTYGNLTFSNGGSVAKTTLGDIIVNGDFLINAGATLNPDSNKITLYGNYTNNGTYQPVASTLILNGVSKTFTGASTLYNLYIITGSYTVASGAISMAGDLFIDVTGSFSFGNNNAFLDGNLTNKGSLTSNGTATFTGIRVQTLQLINAITSSSTGIINFNGTISPVLNSSSAPTFATVNINNTGGISPSVPWSVFFSFNVAAGASFNGGALSHTFYGDFTNNGTFTSSGNIKFKPGAPFSASATITLDGISFVSTGGIELAGTAPITLLWGNPSVNNLNITNTNAAGVTIPSAITINQDMYVAPNSILNLGAGNVISLLGNLTNNGTITGGTSTFSFGGNPVSIEGTGTTSFFNLTIASGADITLNESIEINSNLVDNGNLTATGRKVKFTGSQPSIISGTVPIIILGDVEQNKPNSTTTLSVPVTFTGDLMLTDGIIKTTAVNLLTLSDSATSTSGNVTSFVDGPLKKIGSSPFVFPLGSGTKWARLGISSPALATDAFTAQYFATAYSNTSSMAVVPTPTLNNVSLVEYWVCNRTTGTSNITTQLFWEDATFSGITNYSDVVVAHWNGAAWENMGASAVNGSNPGDVTSTIMSSFSPITFGSTFGSNPLPIELLHFNAVLNSNKKIDLNWETATEINNNYFTVEKSIDAFNFEVVVKVKGAGNSTVNTYYSAQDANPYSNISYYRLKQTDYNGKFSYSEIQSIEIKGAENGMDVFPNPGNGESFNLSFKEKVSPEVLVVLYNSLGEEIFSKIIINDTLSVLIAVDIENKLAPGIYSIIATSNNQIYKKKLLIK
jgi:fibronectin-binding autotransporter adhesin